MESIHVRQTVRPIRFAFLTERGDWDAFLTAVSLNTSIWGGMYNPLIDVAPTAVRDGLIEGFDPDYLVHLSGPLDSGLRDRFPSRIIEPDTLVAEEHQSGVRYLRLGLHVGPILQKIHREEVRFLQQPGRAVLVQTDEPAWSRLIPVLYGSYSHLPQQQIDFRRLFREWMKATEAVIRPGEMPEAVMGGVSPLDVTEYATRLYAGNARSSSRFIFIGDPQSWGDLVSFWNLRAAGRHIVFVPAEGFATFEPQVRRVLHSEDYAIHPHAGNYTAIEKAPSVSHTQYEAVSTWILGLNAGPAARHAWNPLWGPEPGDPLNIQAGRLESSNEEEIALWDGKRMTPIKGAAPRFLPDDDLIRRRDFRWAAEVTMRGGMFDNSVSFSVPALPGTESLVRRMATLLPDSVRISKRGLVISEDFPMGHIYLSPLNTSELVRAIFDKRGFEVEESLPGRYASQIIAKMGNNLHFDCRMFKIKGVREVIDRLSNGSILTKGNMRDIVSAAWRPDANEGLYIRAGQRGALDFTAVFDEMLEKRIIRPGFSLKCSNCFSEDWYHVSDFSEEFTCRFCFTRQRVNFGSKHEWQYKADGLFQIENSALGSLAVIVSLWRFAHLSSIGEGKYATSLKLKDKERAREYEIDFVYMQMAEWKPSDQIVFGEAAGHIELLPADADKMRMLADRFDGAPYLTFSTLRDEFSDAEKGWLRQLSADGYKVIALTRQELDPYDLYKRFESTGRQYAVSLDDLSRNTLELNVGTHKASN